VARGDDRAEPVCDLSSSVFICVHLWLLHAPSPGRGLGGVVCVNARAGEPSVYGYAQQRQFRAYIDDIVVTPSR
jgi:hypothetical protein